MKLSLFPFLALFILLLFPLLGFQTVKHPALVPPGGGRAIKLNEAYGKLPLSFEPNQGQTDPQVQYFSHGNGYHLYITSGEAVLVLRQPSPASSTPVSRGINKKLKPGSPPTAAAPRQMLRMKLSGAQAIFKGQDALPGVSNYLIGNDRSKWRTQVPQYAKVQAEEVYPGVDMVYYGNQSRLEYDFVVKPGADPNSIRLKYEGVKSSQVNAQGDLELEMEGGKVTFRSPAIYQEQEGGAKQNVEGRYRIEADGGIRFEVKDYDKTQPLVIDPILDYSTYLGGNTNDDATSVAVDGSGDAYVVGATSSTNFPTSAGAYQTTNLGGGNDVAFVTELNSAGSAVIYSTYLGGSQGTNANGIALDAGGNAHVIGTTNSTDFPTTAGAYQTTAPNPNETAFVTELNSTGTGLIFSSYLGGGVTDVGIRIVLDPAGNNYVIGNTYSTNFPTTAGAYQTVDPSASYSHGFITKLNPTGTGLVYSTFLGGNNTDGGSGLTVDAAGDAYVTGDTYSTNFPTTAGVYQTSLITNNFNGYVTELNPTGTGLVFSTYFGLIADCAGIALDAGGNVYVTGDTENTSLPTTAGAFQTSDPSGGQPNNHAFVTKFNPTGTSLIYSTYLGGTSGDFGDSIQVDGNGDAYITGYTNSSDYPTTAGAYQTTGGSGNNDVILTELNPQGSGLIYSTYLGYGVICAGFDLALDGSGDVYIVGYQDDNAFPTTAGALQTTNPGYLYEHGFVTKFDVADFYTPIPTATPTQTITNTPTATPNCCVAGWAETAHIFPNIDQVAINYSSNVGYVLTSGSVSIFSLATGTITGVIGTGGQFTNTCLTMGGSGYLYVSDNLAVEKVNPATGVVTATLPIPGTSNVPQGAFEDTNGDLYVTATTGTYSSGVVFRFVYTAPNTYTPIQLTLGTAVPDACGIAKVGNNLFVSNNLGGPAYMFWESSVGSNNYNNVLTLPTGGLTNQRPGQITTDLAGNVFIADEYNDGYFAYNPNGTLRYTCEPSLSQVPFGIGVDASGNVYMSDAVNIRMFQVLSCNLEPTLTYTVQATNTPTITSTPTNSPTPTPTCVVYMINAYSMNGSSGGSPVSLPNVTVSGSNTLLLVELTTQSNNAVGTSVTWGATTLTMVQGYADGYGGNIEFWGAVGPPNGTNTVSVITNVASNVCIGAIVYNNVSQTIPYGSHGSAETTGGNTLNGNCPTNALNSTIVSLFQEQVNGNITLTSGQTPLWLQTPSGNYTETNQYPAGAVGTYNLNYSYTVAGSSEAIYLEIHSAGCEITSTFTMTPTNSPTYTPTATPSPSGPTSTPTNSPTSTDSPTITLTPTITPTPTNTSTPTITLTPTISPTPTVSPTATLTPVTVTTIFPPYPNPVTGNGPIRVNLICPNNTHLSWDVFTTAFRKIESQSLVVSGSGSFSWDLRDKEGNAAANGLYYLRVTSSGVNPCQQILKILILR